MGILEKYEEKHFIISNLATNNSSAIYELKDLVVSGHTMTWQVT